MLNQSGLELRVIVMPPAVVLSRTQCLAFVDNRSLYLLRSLSGLIAFSVRAIRNLFLRRKFVWTTSVGKKMFGGGISPARQLWPMFFYRSTAKEDIAGGY